MCHIEEINPDLFKSAKVLPMYKNAHEKTPENFREIQFQQISITEQTTAYLMNNNSTIWF